MASHPQDDTTSLCLGGLHSVNVSLSMEGKELKHLAVELFQGRYDADTIRLIDPRTNRDMADDDTVKAFWKDHESFFVDIVSNVEIIRLTARAQVVTGPSKRDIHFTHTFDVYIPPSQTISMLRTHIAKRVESFVMDGKEHYLCVYSKDGNKQVFYHGDTRTLEECGICDGDTCEFTIPPTYISITLYDLLGSKVCTLRVHRFETKSELVKMINEHLESKSLKQRVKDLIVPGRGYPQTWTSLDQANVHDSDFITVTFQTRE